MKRILFLAVVCSALCFSCTKPGGTSGEALSITLENELVTADSGGCFVEIKSPGAWNLVMEFDGESGWARLNKESGDGNATVVLSYDANAVGVQRELTLRLSCNRESVTSRLIQDPPMSLKSYSMAVPTWMELPAVVEHDDRLFRYYKMTVGQYKGRNYSYYLDKRKRVSQWVAYPLNKNLIGSGTRHFDDEYVWTGTVDTSIPRDWQAVVVNPFSRNQRGHQCPSADRLQNEANLQTFYGVNMTPQRGDLNGRGWELLERKVRDWSSQFDTLYVVTGADIEGTCETSSDGEKNIAIPHGYFKALLGYKRSATIGMTSSTGGYTAIGFYIGHDAYDGSDLMEKKAMTIDALEEKVGLDFFVNLPASIGETYASRVESTRDPWWR